MITITATELKEILDRHVKWLRDEDGGEKADLSYADLRGANLREADLRGANLYRADLENAKGLPPIACPKQGAFIAFKQAIDGIVKLEVCEDALRSSATTRKCRCSKAKVLAISKMDGTPITEARSQHDPEFVYRVGEIVSVDNFCEDRWNECAPGIHFYLSEQDARNHPFI